MIEESIAAGHPLGGVRAERPHAVEARSGATSSAFLTRGCGATARWWARRREEAFFVKCDEETNPPEVVDAGQVVALIGIAPVKPAEFVIFRIGQHSGGVAQEEAPRG